MSKQTLLSSFFHNPSKRLKLATTEETDKDKDESGIKSCYWAFLQLHTGVIIIVNNNNNNNNNRQNKIIIRRRKRRRIYCNISCHNNNNTRVG